MKLNIPSRSSLCSAGHPFGDHDHVFSELFKGADGSFTRKDSCERCYHKSLDAYCTWHAAQHPKKTEPTELLELFRQSQEGDPKELFFLAEILLRQKQLLRRSRSKDEVVVEDAVTGELYWLPRFDLTLGEVRHYSMKYVAEESTFHPGDITAHSE